MTTPTDAAVALSPIYAAQAARLSGLIVAAKTIIDALGLGDSAETAETASGLSALMDTLQDGAKALTANLEALAE